MSNVYHSAHAHMHSIPHVQHQMGQPVPGLLSAVFCIISAGIHLSLQGCLGMRLSVTSSTPDLRHICQQLLGHSLSIKGILSVALSDQALWMSVLWSELLCTCSCIAEAQ